MDLKMTRTASVTENEIASPLQMQFLRLVLQDTSMYDSRNGIITYTGQCNGLIYINDTLPGTETLFCAAD